MEEISKVEKIVAFDGQVLWLNESTSLYELGTYLGGGSAGTVYAAEHIATRQQYAIKVLNPLGYKITSSIMLRRCTIARKGSIFDDGSSNACISKEHVWWLYNDSIKQYVACFFSGKDSSLKELTLQDCNCIWGDNYGNLQSENGNIEVVSASSGCIFIPQVAPKYLEYLEKRECLFREIKNMRKISQHPNVIKLQSVLEYIQDSKCTIFLVMELANGGELFDRIKNATNNREILAQVYFRQLLNGVKHCHDQGVCHRDLKPENLLLHDTETGESILKIADFGFSTHYQEELIRSKWRDDPVASIGESPFRVLKSIVGSPFYVAPEVIQARGYDGAKADVWSLGVILYAIYAGKLPFGQELSTCKRFRTFCNWIRDQSRFSVRFWENQSLEYPSWLFPSDFSTSVKSLIVAMLHPDPSVRINIIDAMEHPIYKQMNSQETNPVVLKFHGQQRDENIDSILDLPSGNVFRNEKSLGYEEEGFFEMD